MLHINIISPHPCPRVHAHAHPDIRWNSLDSSNESAKCLLLVQNCFLTQHVLEPTRGDNVLDLILSSNKELVDNVTVVELLGTSDHSQTDSENWE